MLPLPALESLRQAMVQWAQQYLLPFLRVQFRLGLLGLLNGAIELLFVLGVPVALVTASHTYMDRQYTLPRQAQYQAVAWATVSDQIARQADIPSVVPLALWYKESGMLPANPGNCEGIMGLHDLIVTRRHACFTPGPLGAQEIQEQLALGAREFKVRCPQISYTTADPALVKQCYLAYNAGPASRLNPDASAYVMNQYDEAHQNMLHIASTGATYRLENLGAWPTHLALESLILSQRDQSAPLTLNLALPEMLVRPALDMLVRWRDRVANWQAMPTPTNTARWAGQSGSTLENPWRAPRAYWCLVTPHTTGEPALRPALNPVTQSPVLTQDLHGCEYGLPGLDISSKTQLDAALQSPIPGEVTTYTDRWQNTTIRIENDEWIVTLLHPRSFLVRQGRVFRGQRVGVMGMQGQATGPHVHVSIYDKMNRGYIDPGAMIPAFP
jgi:hypothetical protein